MADPQSILTQKFQDAIRRAFGDAHAQTDPLIRASADSGGKFGDYQANVAMSLAKQVGGKPRDVAQKIVDHLQLPEAQKIEIAGPGFINIHLTPAFLSDRVGEMAHDARLGVAPVRPQTVVVDYSGPNVAKEMHVGHLRSTVIGDAIARVLEFQGHKVIRQNHLGDWGTQFGMLIEYMVESGWDPSNISPGGAGVGIADLNRLYREAKKRFDDDAAFATRARQRVVALQAGDQATLEAWRYLIEESKRHFNDVYRRLGVKLTDADIRAESFYNPLLQEVAKELEQSGVARMSDGALCVFPPGFLGKEGNPVPVMLRKSDGGYGYDTTDLAGLRFRIREFHPQRIIYVTDSRQKQHFAMIFKTAEMAGWTTSGGSEGGVSLEHVPFGTVLGVDGKPYKSRDGEVKKLDELLTEGMQQAAAIVTQKNPELSDAMRESIAHAIGIGAIKYADLSTDRIKDYVFSWERMLSFEGNTAPYLINAYVRIKSIFRKAASQGLESLGFGGVKISIGDPAERTLSLKLLQFPGVVDGVASSLEPHRLCTYLYELASSYHQFYERCPVLTAPDDATRNSRLALSDLTARVLRQGLDLLGIQTVEQM